MKCTYTNSANVPSTSAFPTQQPIYQTQSEQTKQPKLQPPAVYKKGPQTKSHVPKAIQTDSRIFARCVAHHLSTLLPEVLRRQDTITLSPVAKRLVTWSIVQRRKAPIILLQPRQILPRSTCCFPLEITPQTHWLREHKGIQPQKSMNLATRDQIPKGDVLKIIH